MKVDEVLDVVYSISNRCEAMQLLHKHVPKSFEIEGIFHTLIEDNFVDCQKITDEFCVVRHVDTKLKEGAP